MWKKQNVKETKCERNKMWKKQNVKETKCERNKMFEKKLFEAFSVNKKEVEDMYVCLG
jgi:hypothetical protein